MVLAECSDCLIVLIHTGNIAQRDGWVLTAEKNTSSLSSLKRSLIITIFWHASYGYAGRMNIINIFNESSFKENLMSGVFDFREDFLGVAPYKIGDEEFVKMFILVDAIYPCIQDS